MVDAQRSGVAEQGPQQLAERGVARVGEAVGAPGRQAPVLAARVEGVRGRAHRHAGGEVLLLCPGVGAAGVYADREVVHDPDRHPGLAAGALRGGQLGVGEPGEPGPEVHPLQQAVAGADGVGRAGVAQAGRPAVPVRAVHLGERAPGGVVLQGLALLGEEVAVGGTSAGAERHLAQQLERLPLELPHGVPVDQRALLQHRFAQPAGSLQQCAQPLTVLDVRGLGDVLDPQVHGVGEAARGGPVRGGVGGGAGHGRVQRVDLDEPGAERPPGPAGQFGEVAEVAHAPGAAGEEGVELDEQSVRASRGRGQAGRGDDQVGVRGAAVGGRGGQPVDAGRELLGRGACLALLGLDAQQGSLGERDQGGRGAGAPAGHRGRQQSCALFPLPGGERGADGAGRARVHAESGQGQGDRGGRGRDRTVRGRAVRGRDAVQFGEAGQVLGGRFGRPRCGHLGP